MPPLAVRYFKTGILFLVLGVLTGLHMAMAHHFEMGQMHPYYVPAHSHVILIGFLLMTLMGVALWKLPARPGNDALARLCYWSLTLATVGRYLAETTLGYMLTTTWLRYATVAAMGVQGLAILAGCVVAWRRIGASTS